MSLSPHFETYITHLRTVYFARYKWTHYITSSPDHLGYRPYPQMKYRCHWSNWTQSPKLPLIPTVTVLELIKFLIQSIRFSYIQNTFNFAISLRNLPRLGHKTQKTATHLLAVENIKLIALAYIALKEPRALALEVCKGHFSFRCASFFARQFKILLFI